LSLLVTFVLLPVQFLVLPLNMSPFDVWNLIGLLLSWLYLMRVRRSVRLPYIMAMWLVLLTSFMAALASPNLGVSLSVILKEIYLYVFFVTLAAVFISLDAKDLRRLLLGWCSVATLHGALIVAQFLSPDIFRNSKAYLERFGAVDVWRPSGLFENANAAAFFQLMALVPLVLLRPSKAVAVLVGTFLIASVVGTGSLGAVAAFLCSLIVAMAAILMVRGEWDLVIKVSALLVVAVVLLGGTFAFVINQQPDFQGRLEQIFYGRTERSAEGRFGLWTRGIDLLLYDTPLLGIGPDGFKYLDIPLYDPPKMTYLHNDLLAFAVERGVGGLLGLVLFGLMAIRKAIQMLQNHKRYPDRVGPAVVIFLAALVAILVESQTHQVFHARQVWVLLALQEATLFKMSESPLRLI